MSYVTVVFIVGLLIAIHEYGHLLAAKLCGIPVERFSIGFGPKLLEVRRGETSYWLSWIPIGGYVLPAIEQDDFRALPAYQRITFALGGPVANVIAALMGLFVLGLTAADLSVFGAMSYAVVQLWTGLQHQVAGIAGLATGAEQLSGIVGIVAIGGAQFTSSVASLLTFAVLMNLSLAVMNLLPLPPLDGGRILFCLLEKIYRPVARAEAPLTIAGWAMVLGLMAYVTVQDVGRLLA
jgi:regulator of sigma E protease